MERNDSALRSPADDFMYRRNDVVIEGMLFSQKHMYGYAMVGKDLFEKVHLSKAGCTATDSVEMMGTLQSLKLHPYSVKWLPRKAVFFL